MAPTETNIRRFNRICAGVALGWLVVLIVGSQVARPTYQDLGGIYVGGVVARLGVWDALYPRPDPRDPFYVGAAGSNKPAMQAIVDGYGVKQMTPYLQPPWQAVLMYPLGWLTFGQAHWVLLAALIACTWLVSLQAGDVLAICAGRVTRGSGVLMLLVASSMLAYRSIRVQNLSPMMAWLLGLIYIRWASGKDRKWPVGLAVAAVVAAVMKVASVALLPLAVAMRRWRMVVLSGVLGVMFLLLTLIVAGTSTMHEFTSLIAPTLGRSTPGAGNKSLQAFLIRLHGGQPIAGVALGLFTGLRWASLLITLSLLRWRAVRWEPATVFAAAASLLSWLLIFSPLCWEHYLIYLCPLWGWLLWEAGRAGSALRVVIYAAIASQWCVLPPVWRGKAIPEPVNSIALVGMIAILLLGWIRLWKDRCTPPAEAPVDTPLPR